MTTETASPQGSACAGSPASRRFSRTAEICAMTRTFRRGSG